MRKATWLVVFRIGFAISLAGCADDRADDQCPDPAATTCLVRLYPQCDFKGAEVCVKKEGYLDAAALKALGLAEGAMRSVKVAPGYYARLDFTGDPTDGWDTVWRGEDACLYGGKDPGGYAFRNVTVQRRTVCRPRPRVFMAMHGSNRLAPPDLDAQWTWVREHLDGIWENNAGMSDDEVAAIYQKIKTRTMITEQDGAKDSPWLKLDLFKGMQTKYPSIQLVREAMAIYKGKADEWNADDVSVARAEYVNNPTAPAWLRYQHVYGGFQPQQFILASDQPQEPTVDQTAGKLVVEQIDGAFAECGSDVCKAHLKRALLDLIGRMHDKGLPFIWFNGTFGDPEEWFKGLKREYFMLEAEGALFPNDVVMIINYQGGFASTPETEPQSPDGAPTATGVLYWLMHQ